MKIGDLVRCVCGEEHRVEVMFCGIAVVPCPKVLPDQWYLVNMDSGIGTTDIPLSPARPTFALRKLRIVPPRKPFIPD